MRAKTERKHLFYVDFVKLMNFCIMTEHGTDNLKEGMKKGVGAWWSEVERDFHLKMRGENCTNE